MKASLDVGLGTEPISASGYPPDEQLTVLEFFSEVPYENLTMGSSY
jgi:hypothetical protein